MNPTYVGAYTNRGLAYANKGSLDQAIADWTKAIALDPKYALAYYNRGLAYRRKGDLDQAIADYTKAIELNPKYLNAYINRGYVYRLKGLKSEAIADFENYLRLAPNASDRPQVAQWIRELRSSPSPPVGPPPPQASSPSPSPQAPSTAWQAISQWALSTLLTLDVGATRVRTSPSGQQTASGDFYVQAGTDLIHTKAKYRGTVSAKATVNRKLPQGVTLEIRLWTNWKAANRSSQTLCVAKEGETECNAGNVTLPAEGESVAFETSVYPVNGYVPGVGNLGNVFPATLLIVDLE